MFIGNLPQLMTVYSQWQNAKLFDACLLLDDAERRLDRGVRFGSIHGMLNHALWVDHAWLAHLSNHDPRLPPMGTWLFDDFTGLHEARLTLDRQLIVWADGLTPEWLSESVTWRSRGYEFSQTVPRWVQVQHFFNHQTHHRGQLSTLLTQAGIDIGETDLPMSPLLND
ncbi:DinB family protein [Chitinilyticum litopenaei]|uniref:DinB family protein n=1 Tax=Chitinilyticum litopenaei TaxID=1121276 RepID=UPI00041167A8|nr:DinB family protein [Chitinilyticum litopenaei]